MTTGVGLPGLVGQPLVVGDEPVDFAQVTVLQRGLDGEMAGLERELAIVRSRAPHVAPALA